MATYTVQLRKVIETLGRDEVKSWFMDYELSHYLTPDEIAVINERGTWTKERLADKILDHYYMREIGAETVALFKHYAKVAMREIMEEKLPLIYSAAIKYDPLVNVDYAETYSGASSGNSTGSSTGLTLNSDTPQGKVSKSDVLSGEYVSSTTGNEVTDNNTTSGSEEYIKKVKGNSGVSATAQRMIQQYRDNIIMIDRDIIEDLADIFMVIY